MRRKFKVGDLVYRRYRYADETASETTWIIIRYFGDGMWEIAKVSDLKVMQVHHTTCLRRVICE